jgi:hypothetical protein
VFGRNSERLDEAGAEREKAGHAAEDYHVFEFVFQADVLGGEILAHVEQELVFLEVEVQEVMVA